MKNKVLPVLLCAALFGSMFLLPPSAVSQTKVPAKNEAAAKPPVAPPAEFALLVGINHYNDPQIHSLQGCENDVKLMRAALTNLYGFKTGDIKELTTAADSKEKPTQQAIINNFRQFLIKNAQTYYENNHLTSPEEGAKIVFYYSGHGSHLLDLPSGEKGADGTNFSKDETDGEDETIVAMDSDRDTGAKDIRDDQFDELFGELKKFTANVTFIFDSCHSGTITRGGDSTARDVGRISPAAGGTRGGGIDVPLNKTLSAGAGYVTISGSLPNETSGETVLPLDPKIIEKLKLKDSIPELKTGAAIFDGYLTNALVQQLTLKPDGTYREIMQRVKTAVVTANKHSQQHPQAEGSIDRVFLNTTATGGTIPIFIKGEPTKTGAATVFKIDAGQIIGASQGGTVDVYYPNILDQNRIAAGTITDADQFEATVTVTDENFTQNAAAKTIDRQAQIVLRTPFFGSRKRIIALDSALADAKAAKVAGIGDKIPAAFKRLADSAPSNKYYETKTVDLKKQFTQKTAKDWDAALLRSTYGEFTRGNQQGASKDVKMPADNEDIYYLADRDGDPLYNFWVSAADQNADAKINEALEKFARVENLRNIDNGMSDLSKNLKIEMVRISGFKQKPTGGCEATADENAGTKVLKPGDYYSLRLINNTNTDLYLYLYDIAPDGEISLLHPPAGAEEKWKAGVTIETRDRFIAGCDGGLFQISEYGTGAGQTLTPYGTETLKLIASTQPFQAELLTSPAIARDVNRRGNGNPLEDLLIEASTNRRGSVQVSFPVKGWATASLDFQIRTINVYEGVGGNVKNLNKKKQKNFVADNSSVYRQLSDSLISEGKLPEAQAVLDLLKDEEYGQFARSGETADTVPYSQSKTDAVAKIDKLATLGREQTELRQLQKEQGEQFPADKQTRLEQIAADIKTANVEFDNALAALSKADAGVGQQIVDIKSERNLQSALQFLGKEMKTGAVALYTVIGTEDEKDASGKPLKDQTRSKFGWVILVTKDTRKAYPIDVANLEQTVFQFKAALSSDKYDPKPLAEKLYTAIFRQTSAKQKVTLEQDLNDILGKYPDKTLMWSLDGVLRYIPMAALNDGNSYLVEKYRNVLFTKESLISLKDQPNLKPQALGLGVSAGSKDLQMSALPGVDKELSDIIKQSDEKTGILSGTRKLNAQFKKQELLNLEDEDNKFQVVHIASHYSFNPTDQNASYLLVGDGKYTFGEMKTENNLFGTVDLLTLSACDTGVSGNGKEAEGFAYLAQSLGAKSVIASLWEVSDAGTPELMIRFYKLRSEHPEMSKGEAFREAQLAMLGVEAARKDDGKPAVKRSTPVEVAGENKGLTLFAADKNHPFAHPHYWASFVLIGNWR